MAIYQKTIRQYRFCYLFLYLVHSKTYNMRKALFCSLLLLCSINLLAQKKPLDHTVYDSWQSIGEKMISDDGKIVVYTITPQEGDATLVVQQSNGKKLLEIARGYMAKITRDAKFVVFKIKPTFQQTRDAKIKKKKPEEMPKDSLAIFDIANNTIEKHARVKSYKLAEEDNGYVAWLNEKNEGEKKKDDEEGTLLTVKHLARQAVDSFAKVSEYVFDKSGTKMLIEITANKKDSLRTAVVRMDLLREHKDTLLKNFGDARGYAFDEEGNNLAFVATKDTGKIEQKNYSLYYCALLYPAGGFNIRTIDSSNTGLTAKWRINENAVLSFSKKANRLFFGTSPALPIKDTTLPEFERANVDVWHYNDDDLQPAQLKNLETNLKKSYTAVYDIAAYKMIQLGNENFERVQQTLEGDGAVFYTASDSGKRVAGQWQGYTLKDVYAINPENGKSEIIYKNLKGNLHPSYTGKYLLMYDERKKQYLVYNHQTKQVNAVAKDIAYPLYDEENDVPDDPNAYGIAGWEKDDKYVYVYDRYDIWKVEPNGKEKSSLANMPFGRKNKIVTRYNKVDIDEKYIDPSKESFFKLYNENTKLNIYTKTTFSKPFEATVIIGNNHFLCNGLIKADSANVFMYSAENVSASANIYIAPLQSPSRADTTKGWHVLIGELGTQLSNLNPQQSQYNWLTAELFKWKAYTGKETEGILYKPENFDPKKKYPMIVYFYERNNQTLYNYLAPSPTPSRLNIPFFVSRGYIVFVPDIWYKTGKPGQSAYDYIVSGTRAVVKQGFVDSTKIGLQGQSWGGYQTAQLITMTKLYAAAWAGAPVANMFSAYGGIRWESGVNRQFQYEHTQSRIGATIWDRPDLYIENSPLFHLKKVTTPLVIMSNDKDGAVPWYQGIELFTALRRLDKKVWLLNYNDEAHNLVERRNRKDIQIREQQYFDWLLKGDKAPTWITEGVPAIMKGRTWGL